MEKTKELLWRAASELVYLAHQTQNYSNERLNEVIKDLHKIIERNTK